jgi:drug/metabolite transporter (DMT)-like permease
MHRLAILAAAALMSTGGAAVKSSTLSAIEIAALRSLVAACVLLLLPEARRGPWNARTLLVGALLATTMVLFVVSNKLTTAANAIFLQTTAPIYVLLLAPRLLGERIRRADLWHMAALALGLALFFVDDQAPSSTAPQPRLGNVVAMIAALSWAGTLMGLRRLASGSEHARGGATHGDDGDRPSSVPALVVGNLLAFSVGVPALLGGGAIAASDWLIVSYLGVFQLGISYFLFDRGVRRVPAIEASLLVLIEPALNPVWAFLVHGERPGVWAFAGGAIILGSTIAKTLADARARPQLLAA